MPCGGLLNRSRLASETKTEDINFKGTVRSMNEKASLNQGIAKAFAGILTAIHAAVFFSAFYLLLQYNDKNGAIRRLLDTFEISFSGYATIIGIALVVYVLSVGAIATFISINENLQSIRFQLENRRTIADVSESHADAAPRMRAETAAESGGSRTPPSASDDSGNAMLYIGIVGFFMFIVVVVLMAWR